MAREFGEIDHEDCITRIRSVNAKIGFLRSSVPAFRHRIPTLQPRSWKIPFEPGDMENVYMLSEDIFAHLEGASDLLALPWHQQEEYINQLQEKVDELQLLIDAIRLAH